VHKPIQSRKVNGYINYESTDKDKEIFVCTCRLPYAFKVKIRGTYYSGSICNNNELKIVSQLTPVITYCFHKTYFFFSSV